MLTLDGVHTYYGKSHVLHGVSIRVDRGEVVAFWARIMEEHSEFIAHLLDPTQKTLIATADRSAEMFRSLRDIPRDWSLAGAPGRPASSDELGVPPSPETEALVETLRARPRGPGGARIRAEWGSREVPTRRSPAG